MICKTPLISVVIPSYNSASTIGRAISSVEKQSFENWELFVVDDGSKDDTGDIVKKMAVTDERIHYYPLERNSGVSYARNKGIELSQGDYIAFLDSDDSWQEEKLEDQLVCVKKTGADICYTSYSMVDKDGRKIRDDYLVPENIDYDSMLCTNVIGCSTVLISSEIIKEHPFDSKFYHEDYVLWLQLLKEGYSASGCRKVLTNWCYQQNSRSFNKLKSFKNRWKIYRDCFHIPVPESMGYIARYSMAGIQKYKR